MGGPILSDGAARLEVLVSLLPTVSFDQSRRSFYNSERNSVSRSVGDCVLPLLKSSTTAAGQLPAALLHAA
jgi:hypothetical protein